MFVSYAQNFEDVMLWRALKHIDRGFYIDVGANDPEIDSVTKAFYDRGWRGINIEPLAQHFEALQRQRPEDVNLCCAAGARSGDIEIFECDVVGWATAAPSVADQHIGNGHAGQYRRVPLSTLAEICEKHVSTEIHFLKIDVEGLEKEVIAGADFQRFRPWILVVEATRPNSTDEVHQDWEGLLLAARYRFAYADGVNRFYIAEEHPELVAGLRYPPNVLDDFVSAARVHLENRTRQLEARIHHLEGRTRQAEASLSRIYASLSWKLTAPLRQAGKMLVWLTQGANAWFRFAPMSRPRRLAARFLRFMDRRLTARPRIRFQLLRVLSRFPELKGWLKHRQMPHNFAGPLPHVEGGEHLTPRARRIHAALSACLEQYQGGLQ